MENFGIGLLLSVSAPDYSGAFLRAFFPLFLVFLCLILMGLLWIIVKCWVRRLMPLPTLGAIEKMSGEEFERALRQILEREGWAVELTPRSNDFGADLVIHRQGKRVVVQAKRWRRPAGIKSVQEAAGARDRYRADEAWVVSPSGFTRSAVEQAKSSRVRLKGGDWLLANLKESN